MKTPVKHFLFSIDLEDVRLGATNGLSYEPRVIQNVEKYLKWLNHNRFTCTFFIVGETAAIYPSIISEIISEGHEIACHTMHHKLISCYTPAEFEKDLEDNLAILQDLGAKDIIGFRAPSYSLTLQTQWAYDILKRLGFLYSSSVLPTKNPLFTGWPQFGKSPKITDQGIIELPLTIRSLGLISVPFSGGIYFRLLPKKLIGYFARKQRHNEPLIGYFHPYDIDTEQEKFMQGGINNSRFYNWLMYYNRGSVFDKLDAILDYGYKVITYKEYLSIEYNGRV